LDEQESNIKETLEIINKKQDDDIEWLIYKVERK
jgi:hypothetical protein